MRTILLLFVVLLTANATLAQQAATRAIRPPSSADYYDKRDRVFENRPVIALRGTLLKITTDYLIISDTAGEQQVVWLNRYAKMQKKHKGIFQKTRKVYVEEMVPGTAAKLEAVRDEQGRLILKKLTVYDTVQEFEPVALNTR